MSVTTFELEQYASYLNLVVQHDCGGYRIARLENGGYRYLHPDTGICPTATRNECMTFLRGYREGVRVTNEKIK